MVFHRDSNKKRSADIGTFPFKKWEEFPTLKSLKDERLKREARELKLLKEKISTLLEETENCIAQGKVKEAKQSLYSLRDKIVRIKDVVIRQRYIQAQDALTKLEDALEQKRIARLAEEQRRKMKRHVRGKKNRNESKESRNARKKNFVETAGRSGQVCRRG